MSLQSQCSVYSFALPSSLHSCLSSSGDCGVEDGGKSADDSADDGNDDGRGGGRVAGGVVVVGSSDDEEEGMCLYFVFFVPLRISFFRKTKEFFNSYHLKPEVVHSISIKNLFS